MNDVVPIDFNKNKKLLWKKLDKKIIKILDDIFYNNENREKYIKYIHRKIKEEYKEILDDNNFLFLIMNNRYCTHIFKRGRMEGKVCGAKIEINTTSNKYLCSRHCRDYKTKNRKYTMVNPRCMFVRSNGNQCKHRCFRYDEKCYIHKEIENKKYNNIRINKINKLKYLRLLYYKNKNINKYKNKNIIIKSKTHKNIISYYIHKDHKNINKYIFKKKNNHNLIYDVP